jgi:hypothetical protein
MNEERTEVAIGIGELHIAVVSKKELARLVKTFPYRIFGFSTPIGAGAYKVLDWEEQNCNVECDPLQFWYDEIEKEELDEIE